MPLLDSSESKMDIPEQSPMTTAAAPVTSAATALIPSFATSSTSLPGSPASTTSSASSSSAISATSLTLKVKHSSVSSPAGSSSTSTASSGVSNKVKEKKSNKSKKKKGEDRERKKGKEEASLKGLVQMLPHYSASPSSGGAASPSSSSQSTSLAASPSKESAPFHFGSNGPAGGRLESLLKKVSRSDEGGTRFLSLSKKGKVRNEKTRQ